MIIGLSGKKQSGKDTVASMIQYHFMKADLDKHNMELSDSGYSVKSNPDFSFQIFQNWSNNEKKQYSNWERKQFAFKPKQIVALLIGCTVEQLEDEDFKNTPLGDQWKVKYLYREKVEVTLDEEDTRPHIPLQALTPRKILQLVGTEGMRDVLHPNVWVNSLMVDYKPTNNCTQHSDGLYYTDEHGENEVIPIFPNWIVTDVRFPNEAEAIKKAGGILLRVDRPSLSSISDTHKSEIALDDYKDFDLKLVNKGSIADLLAITKQSLKNIGFSV